MFSKTKGKFIQQKINHSVVLQGQSNGKTIRGEFIVIPFTSKLDVSSHDPVNGV